jgi:hypothetical protein
LLASKLKVEFEVVEFLALRTVSSTFDKMLEHEFFFIFSLLVEIMMILQRSSFQREHSNFQESKVNKWELSIASDAQVEVLE